MDPLQNIDSIVVATALNFVSALYINQSDSVEEKHCGKKNAYLSSMNHSGIPLKLQSNCNNLEF